MQRRVLKSICFSKEGRSKQVNFTKGVGGFENWHELIESTKRHWKEDDQRDVSCTVGQVC